MGRRLSGSIHHNLPAKESDSGGLYPLIGGFNPKRKRREIEGGRNASMACPMRKVPHVRISSCQFAHYRLRGVISAGRIERSCAGLTIDRRAGDSTPLRTCLERGFPDYQVIAKPFADTSRSGWLSRQ